MTREALHSRVMLRYVEQLSVPRTVLWGYLLWYASVLVRYFDPSPLLWINSLGIAAVIGTGLYLSTSYGAVERTHLGRWQVFRLYLMPFCVSSFASLIKGRGFVLVFHPTLRDNALTLAALLGFLAFVGAAKHHARRRSTPPSRERPATVPGEA